MIILHAGYSDDRLYVWGETPLEEAAPGPVRRSGRASKRGSHPFAAGPETLARAVADEQGVEAATAWLPTAGKTPIPSSPLIGPAPDGPSAIAPWAVTALPLDAPRAVNFLCACGGKTILQPGLMAGADLAYWSAAMRLAGALVARQQFLPDLVEDNGRYRSCWKPVLAGDEAGRVRRLAASMPGAARAVSQNGSPAPDAAPFSVLSSFLSNVVDWLVRHSRGERKRAEPDSLHDAWVQGLESRSGVLRGEPAKLAELALQVREWRRRIAISEGAPFRLCFRLEEPSGGEADELWLVRYLLQDAADPSLLVPADQAWSKPGVPRFLKAGEYLLQALGQAAGITPAIEASLKEAQPGGYQLGAAGAQQFLTETAGALEQAGFGVLLPAWWSRKGTKTRLSVRARVASPMMKSGGGLSLDVVVQFDWEVALGDQKLSRGELQALAELKAPLVKVRGQWVQMSAEEIQAALEFWKRRSRQSATARDIVRMALGADRPAGALDFQGVSATGWIGDLLAQLEGGAAFRSLSPPRGFQGELRPYQRRGYSWLAFLKQWGLGACLADDMGLGKTIQTLALIQRDWESGNRQPVLLVCPTSVVGNWQKEAARFTPDLPVLVHHGLRRARGEAFARQSAGQAIVVSSYALLQRDFEVFNQVPWSGVVLDEAQNIKNPATKQARAARGLSAGFRAALTGTPVENHVGELWSILQFLNPGFLGNESQFRERFFIPIQFHGDARATQTLKRLTGPFILRRLKSDPKIIADLPKKMEMKVFCNLTREQASLYEAVVRQATDAIENAEGIGRRGVILATLTKLKQVCNHPAHFLGDNSAIPGRSGKLARLTEMIEEILEVGDRALVFTQFFEMGALLRRHLQETFGREALFLHGGVPKKHRDDMVERFQQENGGPPIFLLSLKAGGTGLNLTRANHVFHFDRWWNPAVENQATDRAHRIGQRRAVEVHKFLCLGTVEEKIDEMIERKKQIAGAVVGTGEGWLTELSTAELRDLFALRESAVGE